MIPSPVCLTSRPAWRARASRTMPSWMRRSRSAPSSPRRWARAVEPSRSVNRTMCAREPSLTGRGIALTQKPPVQCLQITSGGGAELLVQETAQILEDAQGLGRVPLCREGLHEEQVARLPVRGEHHEGARSPLGRRELRPPHPKARYGDARQRAKLDVVEPRAQLEDPRGVEALEEATTRGVQGDARGPQAPAQSSRATADSASWIALAAASRSMSNRGERKAELRSALDRRRPEDAPELGQQDAQRRLGPCRQLPRPERLDQLVPGHGTIAVRRQVDEEELALATRQIAVDAPIANLHDNAPADLDPGAHRPQSFRKGGRKLVSVFLVRR